MKINKRKKQTKQQTIQLKQLSKGDAKTMQKSARIN